MGVSACHRVVGATGGERVEQLKDVGWGKGEGRGRLGSIVIGCCPARAPRVVTLQGVKQGAVGIVTGRLCPIERCRQRLPRVAGHRPRGAAAGGGGLHREGRGAPGGAGGAGSKGVYGQGHLDAHHCQTRRPFPVLGEIHGTARHRTARHSTLAHDQGVCSHTPVDPLNHGLWAPLSLPRRTRRSARCSPLWAWWSCWGHTTPGEAGAGAAGADVRGGYALCWGSGLGRCDCRSIAPTLAGRVCGFTFAARGKAFCLHHCRRRASQDGHPVPRPAAEGHVHIPGGAQE